MSNIEACFFDLDGTAVDGQGRLYDGLEEALDPAGREFTMSILTARGFTRYQEAVRDNPALTVTPGIPVALENGGRIIDSTASENLHYQPLSTDEQTAICDYIRDAPPLRYVAFHDKELRTKTCLWSPDPAEAERLHTAYSDNANVFTGSKDELFRAIREGEPCMLTCRTNKGAPDGLPAGVKRYGRGTTVNFVPQSVDKGNAASVMADMAGIPLPNLLAAGNDYNDMPILGLAGLGCPVAVGPDMTPDMLADLPASTVYLPLPQQLGGFVLERTR